MLLESVNNAVGECEIDKGDGSFCINYLRIIEILSLFIPVIIYKFLIDKPVISGNSLSLFNFALPLKAPFLGTKTPI